MCPIHGITQIIAFEVSTQVHDFTGNLHINFCSFKKNKKITFWTNSWILIMFLQNVHNFKIEWMTTHAA